MQSYNECFSRVKNYCFKYISYQETKNQKFKNKDQMIRSFLIPICFWIAEKSKRKDTLIIGLSGGQGTGKTTIFNIKKILQFKCFQNFNRRFL